MKERFNKCIEREKPHTSSYANAQQINKARGLSDTELLF